MEASGTSGEKAGINGVINLSVLDGWWGEGYNGENGWAITPHGPQYDSVYRDREEGQELLDILEKQVIPLYYARNGHGYSDGWVRKSKTFHEVADPALQFPAHGDGLRAQLLRRRPRNASVRS